MSALSEFANAFSQYLAVLSWQIGVLILAATVAASLLRNARPSIRYILWLVVLVRLCIPVALKSPLGIGTAAAPKTGAVAQQMGGAPVALPRQIEGPNIPNESPTMPDTGLSGSENERQASPSLVAAVIDRSTVWTWLGFAWAVGASWLSAIVILRSLRLHNVVRKSIESSCPVLIRLMDDSRERLGIRNAVRLKVLSPEFGSLGPCATGLIRPTILIPTRMAKEWEPSAIEPVLLHELAHIRRRDVLVQAIQLLTQIVYWFHPLVWFAYARLRHERELICDDIAVAHSGGNSRSYGTSLVRALEECRIHSSWHLAGVGIGESRVKVRLRRLLDRKYRVPRPLGMITATLVFAVGVMGILVASNAQTNLPVAQSVESNSPRVAIPSPADRPTVRVRVIDPAGKPVEGATVTPTSLQAESSDIWWQPEMHGPSVSVKTDHDGSANVPYPMIAFGEIPATSLTLTVEHPQFSRLRHRGYPVAGTANPLVLHPGATMEISGYLNDPDSPLSGLVVRNSTGRSNNTPPSQSWKEVRPGVLRNQQLPEGKLWIQLVQVENGIPALFSAVTEVEVTQGKTQHLKLPLKPGVRLEGTFDESVPRPVENGWVSISISAREMSEGKDGNYGERLEWFTGMRVREDGSFVFPSLPPGDAALIAGCTSYVSAGSSEPDGMRTPHTFVMEGKTTRVSVPMDASGSAVIRVVDAKDRPVSGAKVSFFPNIAWRTGVTGLFAWVDHDEVRALKSGTWPEKPDIMPSYSAETNAEGLAEIASLPSGSHYYSATHPELEPAADGDFPNLRLSVKSGETGTATVVMRKQGLAAANRSKSGVSSNAAEKNNASASAEGTVADAKNVDSSGPISDRHPEDFGLFEIRAVSETPDATTKAYTIASPNRRSEIIYLAPGAALDQSAVKSASLKERANGKKEITFIFTPEGQKSFADFTTKHVGKRCALILDSRIQSVPVINEPIRGGNISIIGNWTTQEAEQIVARLLQASWKVAKDMRSQRTLPKGKSVGLYTYTSSSAVKFTQEAAFPVKITISTVTKGTPVHTTVISDEKPFTIEADLPLGDYVLRSDVQTENAQSRYWGVFGPQFTIGEDGKFTERFPGWAVLIHKRKIKPLYPVGYEEVHEPRPTLSWEPLPGAARYSVYWIESTSPDKERTGSGKGDTNNAEFTFTEDLKPKTHYEWSVRAYDDSDEEIGYYSAGYFVTPGADPRFKERWNLPKTGSRLGVVTIALPPGVKPGGVLITAVSPDSPASKAGLKGDDAIVEFNGTSVTDMSVSGFVNLIRSTEANRPLPVTFVRDGKRHTVEVTLEAIRPE